MQILPVAIILPLHDFYNTMAPNARARRRRRQKSGVALVDNGDAVSRCHGMGDTVPKSHEAHTFLPPRKCDTVAALPKAVSSSSARIRAAFFASTADTEKMRRGHGQTSKHRNQRANKKAKKIKDNFLSVEPTSTTKKVSEEEMKDKYVVVDGGDNDNPPIKPSTGQLKKKLHILSIRDGDLFVPTIHLNTTFGAIHTNKHTGQPTFLLAPRGDALSITKMNQVQEVNELIHALDICEHVTRNSIYRGNERIIFHDDNDDSKYICLAKKTSRNAPGIVDCPQYKKLDETIWNIICKYISKCEEVFKKFAPTDEIRRILHAKKLVKFESISKKQYNYNSHPSSKDNPEWTGGMAFGRNLYLNMHKDGDFTYSITTVHQDPSTGGYQEFSRIISYFCFPRLGMAVPLRAGDILIFDPQEPHCISSRCKKDDKNYCISTYLKSANVGGNDNSRENSNVIDTLDLQYKEERMKN